MFSKSEYVKNKSNAYICAHSGFEGIKKPNISLKIFYFYAFPIKFKRAAIMSSQVRNMPYIFAPVLQILHDHACLGFCP